MDAALEVVLALGEVVDLQFAALQHARLGYVDIVKAFSHGTLRSSRLAAVKVRYEAAAELLHLREGVRLAALIGQHHAAAVFNGDVIGFEVPVLVRSSRSSLCEQIAERGGLPKRDVVTEAIAERGVERSGIAFVERDHLCGAG